MIEKMIEKNDAKIKIESCLSFLFLGSFSLFRFSLFVCFLHSSLVFVIGSSFVFSFFIIFHHFFIIFSPFFLLFFSFFSPFFSNFSFPSYSHHFSLKRKTKE